MTELSACADVRANRVAAFGGPCMVRLVEMLRTQAARFDSGAPPIGPLGVHMSLSDQR